MVRRIKTDEKNRHFYNKFSWNSKTGYDQKSLNPDHRETHEKKNEKINNFKIICRNKLIKI
jgi:hypothetical protein